LAGGREFDRGVSPWKSESSRRSATMAG
jgi:hypothetical protein